MKPSDGTLTWGLGVAQLISWGPLFVVFPLFVTPMEQELGWTRAQLNGALTCGLLAAGLAAIPAGRVLDQFGGRWLMTLGAWGGGLLVLAWAMTDRLWLFYLVWVAIGLAQAAALSDAAFAVVVANAKDPRRVITTMTFVTGFCSTLFIPFGDALIGWLGWRGALAALAALQLLPGLATWHALRGTGGTLAPLPAARGGIALPAAKGGTALRQALRKRAFWALALCFCAQTFVSTGLSFHIIPLLQERGVAQGWVVALVALRGPVQVGARVVLFAMGARADLRRVGLLCTGLLPVAMAMLAVSGAGIAALLAFALVWYVAEGLITIIRPTSVADVLGRQGFGQVSGAISMATMLPRTAAPLAIALLWQGAGYGPVAWLLAAISLLCLVGFAVATARRG